MLLKGKYIFKSNLNNYTFGIFFKTTGVYFEANIYGYGKILCNGIIAEVDPQGITNKRIAFVYGSTAIEIANSSWSDPWTPPNFEYGTSIINFGVNGCDVTQDVYNFITQNCDHEDTGVNCIINFETPLGAEQISPVKAFKNRYLPNVLPRPTREGYVFRYWTYSNGVVAKPSDEILNSTTLYSSWDKVTDVSTDVSGVGVTPYSDNFTGWIMRKNTLSDILAKFSSIHFGAIESVIRTAGDAIGLPDIDDGYDSDVNVRNATFLYGGLGQYFVNAVIYPFGATDFRNAGGVIDSGIIMATPDKKKELFRDFAMISASSDVSFPISRFSINRRFNDYRDYEPYTNIKLYLPFNSFVDITPSILYTRQNWTLYMTIDFANGSCQFSMIANDGFVLGIWNGTIGIQIPLINTNTYEQNQKRNSALIGMGMQLANLMVGTQFKLPYILKRGVRYNPNYKGTKQKPRLNVDNRKAQQFGTMTQSYVQDIAGISNVGEIMSATAPDWNIENCTGGYGISDMAPTAYMIFTTPKITNEGDTASYVGRPLNKEVSLSDIQGYTEISGIHLEDISCSADELEMIENELRSGVILNWDEYYP